MSKPVIEVSHLTKCFSSCKAIDNLSFDVNSGSIFGLLGSNGSGKTTTVRLLNGILSPTSGNASVFGIDTRTRSKDIRQLCGVQVDGNLYEKLSAYENLRLWGRLYSLSPQTIEKRISLLLETFDLTLRANDIVATFSKGMKQKVLIARALIHEPELLFLDEPTSGLDPLSSRDVLHHLMDYVRNHHKTIFLCSHRLDEVEQLCDIIAIMDAGKLIAMGTPNQLSRQIWPSDTQHSLADIYFNLLDHPSL